MESVLLVLSDGGLEGTQAEGGVPRAATDGLASDAIYEGVVVEGDDLVHCEPVVKHVFKDHAGGCLADDVALTGKGEASYTPLLPGLKVDHDGPSALGAPAGHRHVGVLKYPLVTRVVEVLHEHRYLALTTQREVLPTSLWEP